MGVGGVEDVDVAQAGVDGVAGGPQATAVEGEAVDGGAGEARVGDPAVGDGGERLGAREALDAGGGGGVDAVG